MNFLYCALPSSLACRIWVYRACGSRTAQAEPHGACDSRPTALSIIKDEELEGKLRGKVMLITGCSSGIGVETARAVLATGADVYITVRDEEKGKAVVKDILEKNSSSTGKLELLQLDLGSLQSVKDCAADFLSRSKRLNILINNAGVMACPEGQTADGFETQFGVNHLGHFLLFQLLKPALLASSAPSFNSRVVSLSSSGHRTTPVLFEDIDFKKAGYDPWVSYGQSKTANIYLATEIDRRYGAQGLHANAVHPGGIATPLARHLDPAIVKAMITPELALHMKSPEQGAATTVWAAVSKTWEGTGGRYLEDCCLPGPRDAANTGMLAPGHAPWAYDTEAASKLWDISLQMVGIAE